MKTKTFFPFIVLIFFGMTLAFAHDMSKHGQTVTIQGEVLDSACYFTHDAKGTGHADCATKCVQKGIPMALLDSKGELYLLNEDHEKPKAYEQAKTMAAKKVTVTGKLIENKGWKVLFVEEVK